MAPVRTELPRAGRCSWTPNMAPVTAPSCASAHRFQDADTCLPLGHSYDIGRRPQAPTTLLPPPDPPREHQESPGHPPQCCPESHYARGNSDHAPLALLSPANPDNLQG